VLTEAGYKVLLAGDGDEAVETARRHEGSIDLLFTDIVLPRRSGWDVAESLLAERPEMRLLFSSGYAEDAMERLGVPRPTSFLPKPYTPEVLLARIRALLDRDS
jgi:DNA-binding response OmpR family regulator